MCNLAVCSAIAAPIPVDYVGSQFRFIHTDIYAEQVRHPTWPDIPHLLRIKINRSTPFLNRLHSMPCNSFTVVVIPTVILRPNTSVLA